MSGPGLQWVLPAAGTPSRRHRLARARERERLAGMRFTKRRTEYLLRRCAGKRAVAAAYGLGEGAGDLGADRDAQRARGCALRRDRWCANGSTFMLTDRAGHAVALSGHRDRWPRGRWGSIWRSSSRSLGFRRRLPDTAGAGLGRQRSGIEGPPTAGRRGQPSLVGQGGGLKVQRVGLRRTPAVSSSRCTG